MERVLWITSISANTLEGLDPTISIWSCGVLARFGPWAECVVIYTRMKRTPYTRDCSATVTRQTFAITGRP
jgi:hypothetical protein